MIARTSVITIVTVGALITPLTVSHSETSVVQSADEPERVSLDGTPLPEITVKPLDIALPSVGWMGCAPEKITKTIVNVHSDRGARLREAPRIHRSVGGRFPWVAVGVAGSNNAYLRLSDGCVTSLQLWYSASKKRRAEHLWRSLERRSRTEDAKAERLSIETQGKPDLQCRCFRETQSRELQWIRIDLQIDNIDWLKATGQITPEIAEAIDSRILIQGMTIEEAILALDSPTSTTETNGEIRFMRWEFHEVQYVRARSLDRRVVGTRRWLARTVTATVENGIIDSITDTTYER